MAAVELSQVLGLDKSITEIYLARAGYGTVPVNQSILQSANNIINLSANAAYYWEMLFAISGSTTSTASIGLSASGATGSVNYIVEATSASAINSLGTPSSIWINTAGSVVVLPNTSQFQNIMVRGTIRTSASGAFLPTINFTSAPGNGFYIPAGAYTRLTPLGSSSVAATSGWT